VRVPGVLARDDEAHAVLRLQFRHPRNDAFFLLQWFLSIGLGFGFGGFGDIIRYKDNSIKSFRVLKNNATNNYQIKFCVCHFLFIDNGPKRS
jgi:hypothetical protein